MALTPIQPRQQQVKPGKKGGAGLGRVIGALGGAAAGIATANPGIGAAVGGALTGAATGASVGSMLGGAAKPGEGPQAQQQSAPVPLTAMQESQRGNELLEGIKIARNTQSMQEYAGPLTEAFIQSRANLHRMG